MNIEVTTGADDGPGSLRQAIIAANAAPGSTITFSPAVTLVSLESELLITENMTIIGNGSSLLEVTRATADLFRIFSIIGNPDAIAVSITEMTISNGFDPTANGGGIIAINATLNLEDVIITGNLASNGGGIFASGSTISLSNSVVSDNSSSIGGGINSSSSTLTLNNSSVTGNTSSTGGGIFVTSSTASLVNSTISGNLAATGTGGGILSSNSSSLSIESSTISNNTSETTGGGITANLGSSLSISNSTISTNNTIGNGGGIFLSIENATIINSTITNNTSSVGSGVTATSATVTVMIGNTIIAENNGSGDAFGTFVSLGNNLIGAGDLAIGFVNNVNGDQVGTGVSPIDPLLGPLVNNGGPTLTHALLPGSPAIDAGNNANAPGPFDQRGPGFLRIVNGIVDIGSFEVQAIVICYSGESLVLTKNILTKEIKEIAAKDVISGIHLVFDVNKKLFVPVKLNIVTGNTERFMKINKDSVAENQPNQNFYVTSGHRIMIDGVKVKARYITQAKRVKVPPQKVYSICT